MKLLIVCVSCCMLVKLIGIWLIFNVNLVLDSVGGVMLLIIGVCVEVVWVGLLLSSLVLVVIELSVRFWMKWWWEIFILLGGDGMGRFV